MSFGGRRLLTPYDSGFGSAGGTGNDFGGGVFPPPAGAGGIPGVPGTWYGGGGPGYASTPVETHKTRSNMLAVVGAIGIVVLLVAIFICSKCRQKSKDRRNTSNDNAQGAAAASSGPAATNAPPPPQAPARGPTEDTDSDSSE